MRHLLFTIFLTFISMLSHGQNTEIRKFPEPMMNLTSNEVKSEEQAFRFLHMFFDTEVETTIKTTHFYDEELEVEKTEKTLEIKLPPSAKLSEYEPISAATQAFYVYSLAHKEADYDVDKVLVKVVQWNENFMEDEWEVEFKPEHFKGIRKKLDVAYGYFIEVLLQKNFAYEGFGFPFENNDNAEKTTDDIFSMGGDAVSFSLYHIGAESDLRFDEGKNVVDGIAISYIAKFARREFKCQIWFENTPESK